ncbi:MAG: histidine phosphatase family protein [Clostridiales bacterium]|jgi:probable phosphoglycerate mutase|nr:histidine phosphatase family protein [Clostridiales bacterium]
MVLYVARHGESEYNVQKRFSGSIDIPLNERGFAQAGELAEKLKEVKLDVIVSSSLLRARQTADTINKYHNLPINIRKEFVERNFGVFEGLTWDEGRERYPDDWPRFEAMGLDDDPPNGETVYQVNDRVRPALDELLERYPDKNVLLVCHGFTARIIHVWAKGLPLERLHGFILGNCEVVKYEVEPR